MYLLIANNSVSFTEGHWRRPRSRFMDAIAACHDALSSAAPLPVRRNRFP
jgi:hypothetical protein